MFDVSQRWGDAPVHSIGAALLSRKDQIHFFNDIGEPHFSLVVVFWLTDCHAHIFRLPTQSVPALSTG